jgi:hypothetical protein
MNGVTASLRTALGFIALALGLVILNPSYAWAYIDPGTGSYFFQLMAAGLLAGLYTMRGYWNVLTRTLRGRLASSNRPVAMKRANDME